MDDVAAYEEALAQARAELALARADRDVARRELASAQEQLDQLADRTLADQLAAVTAELEQLRAAHADAVQRAQRAEDGVPLPVASSAARRGAHPHEWQRFLRGWCQAGNQPSHRYDYPFARARFTVADADFVTRAAFGSAAQHILVSAGVRWLGGDLGHTQLYFLADFRVSCTGSPWVPEYSDARH